MSFIEQVKDRIKNYKVYQMEENKKKMEQENIFDCAEKLEPEALDKVYEMYKTGLFANLIYNPDCLFVSHPMRENKYPIGINVQNAIEQKLIEDGFNVTRDWMGPYTEGFYLKIDSI